MILPYLILFIIFLIFITFIVALIKPSLILKKSKKFSRLKVFAIWFILNYILWVLFSFSIPKYSSQEIILKSNNHIKEGNYVKAKSELSKIKQTDSLYKKSKSILKKIDSLILHTEKLEKEYLIQNEKKKFLEKKLDYKNLLLEKINLIDKGIDFSEYRGSLKKLHLELKLFGNWSNIIKESEKYEDSDILKLNNKLKNLIIDLQLVEFPNMRKEYAKILSRKLWRENFDIYASGNRKKIINFTNHTFASNANIEDSHLLNLNQLIILRFKQSRYRWYKEQNNYTSYDLGNTNDNKLVDFEFIQSFFKPF